MRGLDAAATRAPRPRRRPAAPCAAAGSRGRAARRGSPRRTRRRRPPRRPRRPSRRSPAGARVVQAARLELDLAALGHHVGGACRPRSCPTLAVVCVVEPAQRAWTRSPGRGRDGVAARPRAGCRRGRRRRGSGLEPVVGGRGDDQLADRAGVVEHEARTRCAARGGRTPSRPRSAELLQVVNSSSTPTGEPLARPGAAPRPGSWPPRPCCRRPGCPRCGCAARRPRARPPPARPAAPCRDGRRAGSCARPRGPGCARAGCRRPSRSPRRAGVLLHLEPEARSSAATASAIAPLARGRALDLAQADEVGDQPLALGRAGAGRRAGHRDQAGWRAPRRGAVASRTVRSGTRRA